MSGRECYVEITVRIPEGDSSRSKVADRHNLPSLAISINTGLTVGASRTLAFTTLVTPSTLPLPCSTMGNSSFRVNFALVLVLCVPP